MDTLHGNLHTFVWMVCIREMYHVQTVQAEANIRVEHD